MKNTTLSRHYESMRELLERLKKEAVSINGIRLGIDELYCLNIGIKNASYRIMLRNADAGLLTKADKQARELTKKACHVYEDHVEYQLRPILLALDFDLKGKTVFDLGCGSTEGGDNRKYDNGKESRWEPLLCRALQKLGARPVGIDAGCLDNEEFEHYRLNLLEDSLDFMQDNSVDLINACAFFDSPELSKMALEYRTIASRNKEIHERIGERLRYNLFPQLKRIIKPDGFLIYTSQYFIS